MQTLVLTGQADWRCTATSYPSPCTGCRSCIFPCKPSFLSSGIVARRQSRRSFQKAMPPEVIILRASSSRFESRSLFSASASCNFLRWSIQSVFDTPYTTTDQAAMIGPMLTPRLIFAATKSDCHHAVMILVRSREGGLVTRNCLGCGTPYYVKKQQLPTLSCERCDGVLGISLKDKNYAYECGTCNVYWVLPEFLPDWSDLFEYSGLAAPGDPR